MAHAGSLNFGNFLEKTDDIPGNIDEAWKPLWKKLNDLENSPSVWAELDFAFYIQDKIAQLKTEMEILEPTRESLEKTSTLVTALEEGVLGYGEECDKLLKILEADIAAGLKSLSASMKFIKEQAKIFDKEYIFLYAENILATQEDKNYYGIEGCEMAMENLNHLCQFFLQLRFISAREESAGLRPEDGGVIEDGDEWKKTGIVGVPWELIEGRIENVLNACGSLYGQFEAYKGILKKKNN